MSSSFGVSFLACDPSQTSYIYQGTVSAVSNGSGFSATLGMTTEDSVCVIGNITPLNAASNLETVCPSGRWTTPRFSQTYVDASRMAYGVVEGCGQVCRALLPPSS